LGSWSVSASETDAETLQLRLSDAEALHPRGGEDGGVLLVDAANVIGSRPTGWWRDRPKAAREFVEQVRAATATAAVPAPVVIVLEGAATSGVDEGVLDGVQVVHAQGEGDDTLADLAAQATEPVTLVSADRALRERVRRVGGEVVGPSWLLDRLAG
jgi:hypothetical protein